MRPLCKCGIRPKAINYKRNGKTYYRKLCETCMSKGVGYGIPRWKRSGYKPKSQCEHCGHKSPYPEVFLVYHVDGNLSNCRTTNLKTICHNCSKILSKQGVGWKRGDLLPDL